MKEAKDKNGRILKVGDLVKIAPDHQSFNYKVDALHKVTEIYSGSIGLRIGTTAVESGFRNGWQANFFIKVDREYKDRRPSWF